MSWDEKSWNCDILEFYRRLITLRKTNKTLAEGSFEVLHWDGQLVCFQRVLGGERIIVTLNRGPEAWAGRTLVVPDAAVKGESRFDGYLSGMSFKLESDQLMLPNLPKGGEIWLVGSSASLS